MLQVMKWTVAFIVQHSKSYNIDLNVTSNQVNTEKTWNSIAQWLANPLKDIAHVNLMLRSDHYQQDVENTYTQWFMQQAYVPLTLSTYELLSSNTREESSAENRDNFVILTSMKALRSVSRYYAQRSGVYFFVINDAIAIEELRDICHFLWTNFYVYKNYVLTDKAVLIYDPFARNTRNEYGQIIEYTGAESMERTIFYDMRGYPLRIQIFRSVYSKPHLDPITKKVVYVYGVDGRVADLLQNRMNCTMNLMDPNPDYFGERFANGSYSGVIGSIIKNELDMCLTGFFVKDYMVPQMEFSVAVYDDKLCIYTPKAKRVPESILPILSVGYDLWLGFIFTAFVCSVIWAVFRFVNLHLKTPHPDCRHLNDSFMWQYIRILIDTWVLWVRVDLSQYPPFSSEKIFIASLCLVSVIFGAIFESSLATVYIHPMYYKDIYTMQELDESGLFVIYKYTSMADDLFFSETSPLFANLNKKLKHLKDLNFDVLADVAKTGGKASVTRHTTLVLEYFEYIMSEQVWMIPECPKYYTISYVWPKDAPWDETINQLLLRMQNAGLIKKFITDMQSAVDIEIIKNRIFSTKENFKILTIGDLQLAFYVVVMGSLLAFASIAVERWMERKHR